MRMAEIEQGRRYLHVWHSFFSLIHKFMQKMHRIPDLLAPLPLSGGSYSPHQVSARRSDLTRTVQTAERTVPGLEAALETLDPLCSQRAELSYALVQLYGTAPGYTWQGQVTRDADSPSGAMAGTVSTYIIAFLSWFSA